MLGSKPLLVTLLGFVLLCLLPLLISGASTDKNATPKKPINYNIGYSNSQKHRHHFPQNLQRWRGMKYDPQHSYEEKDPYDYIIVGAGSAGAVLAARLSEEKYGHSVLTIEAGPPDSSLNRLIDDPFQMGSVISPPLQTIKINLNLLSVD